MNKINVNKINYGFHIVASNTGFIYRSEKWKLIGSKVPCLQYMTDQVGEMVWCNPRYH